MRIRMFVCGLLLVAGMAASAAAANGPKPLSGKKFDALATAALEAMKAKAAELKMGGVAVVNFAPGDAIAGWSSKMAVVGRMTDEPTATSKGNNLLGVAYAKSAEMARTLVNSGTSGGTPMTGEFGWQGGVTERVKGGAIIVSFSGGKSEDDVQVSKAGLAVMKSGL
jgi:hypothetical protein